MTPPAATSRPIVCIPHAGAGVLAFRGWQRRAGPALVVIGLPGREMGHSQACLTSIADMAFLVCSEVARRRLTQATLFGHSMGALVAYEAARRLQLEQPGALRRLVVSGCRSPTAPSSLRLSAIADDTAFLHAVFELGGLPVEAANNPAIIDYLLPILRADIGAADAYRHEPGAALQLPLLALGGDNDPFVPPTALAAWRSVAGASFELQVLPGGHFFIFEHVDRVLRLLRL